MKIRIYSFGKISNPNLKSLADYYIKLLSKYCKPERIIIKDRGISKIEKKEIEVYLKDGFNIFLTERGESFSTKTFSLYLEKLKLNNPTINFFVGNAFGFTKEAENLADLLLSLSPMTLAHELSMIVLLEQLFRCYNLAAGGKYHK